MSALDAALKYHELGFSVIPVKHKKPLVKWERYQTKLAEPETIKEWYEQYEDAGVGIVTGKLSNLFVLDIDDMKAASEWLSDHLPDQLETIESTTPSGGEHIWFSMPDTELRNTAKVIPGCDTRGEGGYIVAPPTPDYAFKEGRKPGAAQLAQLPSSIFSYIKYNNYNTNYNDKSVLECEETCNTAKQMFGKGTRDDDLFRVANLLFKGGANDAIVRQVVNNLAKTCDPPFNPAEADAKVSSALQRKNTRDGSLADEVKELISVTSGYISVTWACQVLHCITKQEKGNLRVIFNRLVKEGLLERTDKMGTYKVVNESMESIDYLNADASFLDLWFPLDVHEWARMQPGNIAMISGAPNAGKTAYLLAFTEANMDKHEIHYFSSEMGAPEFKTRLSKFDRPLDSWSFHPWERSSGFADVIRPDAVNIIDFLEIHDEFYKVGAFIKEIFDKLNKGIALIALQKNPGSDTGLGGQRSMEKARLALALDNGRCKITKGKTWAREDRNPNQRVCNFKLVQGCKFIPDMHGWHYEGQ